MISTKNYENSHLSFLAKFKRWQMYANSLKTSKFWDFKPKSIKINSDSVEVKNIVLKNKVSVECTHLFSLKNIKIRLKSDFNFVAVGCIHLDASSDFCLFRAFKKF